MGYGRFKAVRYAEPDRASAEAAQEALRGIYGHPGQAGGIEFKESRCIMLLDRGKTHTPFPMRSPGEAAMFLSGHMVKSTDGAYISADAYIGRTSLFSTRTLFSLHNIVIDIDDHGSSPEESLCMANALLGLLDGGEDGEATGIPMPSLAVHTGRGVQLWYFLEPASAKLARPARDVRAELCRLYKGLLGSRPVTSGGFSVDMAGSMRDSGLFRIPGTYSPEAGCWTQPLMLTGKHWALYGLMEELGIAPKKPDGPAAAADAGEEAQGRRKGTGCPRPSRARFTALLLSTLEEAARTGQYTSREVLCHVYHSALLMHGFGTEESARRARGLNGMFPESLPAREVEDLIRCDNRHRYFYSERQMFERAGIPDGLFAQYLERKEALKKPRNYQEENRERDDAAARARIKWHNQIRRLAEKGLTAKEIAEKTGRDVRTVRKYMNTPAETMKTARKAREKAQEDAERRKPGGRDGRAGEAKGPDVEARRRKRVMGAYRNGFRSAEKISKATGIPMDEVSECLRRHRENKKAIARGRGLVRALDRLLEEVEGTVRSMPSGKEATPLCQGLRMQLWDIDRDICTCINGWGSGKGKKPDDADRLAMGLRSAKDSFLRITDQVSYYGTCGRLKASPCAD